MFKNVPGPDGAIAVVFAGAAELSLLVPALLPQPQTSSPITKMKSNSL
jgi:hypothetical protein